jgi:rare lipoprotein A
LKNGTVRAGRLLVLPLLAALAGCGTDGGPVERGSSTRSAPASSSSAYVPPPPPQSGLYKVGKPYQVGGIWYMPQEDFGYVETGVASWYGPNFHGEYTANGETYDMHGLTAAHRTLQMPSVVRVTNLENGRWVIVRINDRGPFARERIIDLSRAAAEAIDMTGRGTAQVRVEILPEESRQVAEMARAGVDVAKLDEFVATRAQLQPGETQLASRTAARPVTPPLIYEMPPREPTTDVAMRQVAAVAQDMPARTAPSGGWASRDVPGRDRSAREMTTREVPVRSGTLFVQAGAFSMRDNAERLKSDLSRFGAARVDAVDVNGRTLHRVRLGPMNDVTLAQATLSRLVENGYSIAQVVVE